MPQSPASWPSCFHLLLQLVQPLDERLALLAPTLLQPGGKPLLGSLWTRPGLEALPADLVAGLHIGQRAKRALNLGQQILW